MDVTSSWHRVCLFCNTCVSGNRTSERESRQSYALAGLAHLFCGHFPLLLLRCVLFHLIFFSSSIYWSPILCIHLEKEMATHSCTLAWRIPWTEEPGCSPRGHKEADTTERLIWSDLTVVWAAFMNHSAWTSLEGSIGFTYLERNRGFQSWHIQCTYFIMECPVLSVYSMAFLLKI